MPNLDPVCAFHGLRADEHEFGRCLFCCLCFDTLTPDQCYVDPAGVKWDMCVACGEAEERVVVGTFEDLSPDVQHRLILWWRWLYGEAEPDRPWLAAMYADWLAEIYSDHV